MINLIKAELFKLKRNHTFWILMGVVPLVYALYLGADIWRIRDLGLYKIELEEYLTIQTIGLMQTILFFNLIISTLAGFFISTDYTTGVVKNQVLSGNKRSHIYLSKLIVFSLSAVITTVILPVVAIIIGTNIGGYNEIFISSTLIYWLRSFGLYTLIIMAYSSVVMLIATLTRESGKTIIITVVMTIILVTIEIVFVSRYEIVKMMYENSIFYQIYQPFNLVITSNEIGKSIFISLVTFIIMAYCGSMIFKSKEIK